MAHTESAQQAPESVSAPAESAVAASLSDSVAANELHQNADVDSLQSRLAHAPESSEIQNPMSSSSAANGPSSEISTQSADSLEPAADEVAS
jgi:hypothetical protein